MSNKFYSNAPAILTGQVTSTSTPHAVSPTSLPCRRLLLSASTTGLRVVPQGQPSGAGFPIPAVQTDGNFTPLMLEVSNVNIVWVVGSGTVYWLAEIEATQP